VGVRRGLQIYLQVTVFENMRWREREEEAEEECSGCIWGRGGRHEGKKGLRGSRELGFGFWIWLCALFVGVG